MVNRVRGDERRGQDDDEGHGSNVRVVQIENAYHEKLRARMGQGGGSGNALATVEPDEKRVPDFVIYGDDGRPIN